MIHQQKKALNAARFSIIANLGLAIVKGIAGFFGNSFALIADAIESTTDVFSSMLVWWGIRLSAKPADDNHPYGHGKIEPLITFVVVGFLLVSATIIVVQSIHNIRTPHAAPAPFTLIVLGVIMVSKEIFYRIVHQKGVETESSSLRADAWHHRSDALTSLMAFVGISIALFMGEGYESADDWAAIFAAGFIAFNAYLIFRPALGEIMDEHLHNDLEAQIRRIAQKIEGVEGTEKCHIRKSGMVYHIDLHLIVNGDLSVREGHEIAHRLKDAIREALPNVADVLIHVEPDSP